MKINGAGTIEKRSKGSYRIRFSLGWDATEKRYTYTPWRNVKGTKTKALEALSAYRQELEGGLKCDIDKITFSEYAQRFADNRKTMGNLSPSTLNGERIQIEHLNCYIADTRLRDIDALMIEGMLATQSRERDASPDQLRKMYRVLKYILEDACNKDYLLRNPCNKVKAPRQERPALHFLDTSGIVKLMKALEDAENHIDKYRPDLIRCTVTHSHVMAVRLALATGMRRGEVLGLTWGYVGMDTGNIRICQQMTSDGLRRPKTDKGNRIVSLDNDTMRRLASWKTEQKALLDYLGIAQCADTPVISNEVGGWMEPRNLSRWWRMFSNRYGFPDLRFHDLRHTQATLLIAQGVDIKTVQNRLGHTLASTTLDLYAGVMPGKDREAANLVGKLLTAKDTKVVNF